MAPGVSPDLLRGTCEGEGGMPEELGGGGRPCIPGGGGRVDELMGEEEGGGGNDEDDVDKDEVDEEDDSDGDGEDGIGRCSAMTIAEDVKLALSIALSSSVRDNHDSPNSS